MRRIRMSLHQESEKLMPIDLSTVSAILAESAMGHQRRRNCEHR